MVDVQAVVYGPMQRDLIQRPEAPWRRFVTNFVRWGSLALAIGIIKTLFDLREGLILQDFLEVGALSLIFGLIGGAISAVVSSIRLAAYKYRGGQ